METVLITRIIEEQFRELSPATVVYLSEGTDSSVFEVNGEWVFRFPKRADVEQQLLVERRILAVLSDGSPLPIPAFSFHGQPSPEFPRSFVGYPKLPGVPAIQIESAEVPPLHLAPKLGRFLSWLHSFPASEAARCGVPNQRIESLIQEVRGEALTDFK
jgi:aminoglycoside phosphotransferase (APT) family kinase protein